MKMADFVDLTEEDGNVDADNEQSATYFAVAAAPPDPSQDEFFAKIGRMCLPRVMRAIDSRVNNSSAQQLYFTDIEVDMPPVAKPSVKHGPGRGGGLRTYQDNEVVAKMDQLRQLCNAARTEQGIDVVPIGTPVMVSAWFFMKRPNEDFIARKRVAGKLKPEAETPAHSIMPIKPDIDNYAKFLLDALTGALFEDDSQVVELHLYKGRDSRGLCNGRMKIQCSIVPEFIQESWD